MRPGRRRGVVIIAASAAVHAAVLAVLAIQAPQLTVPREDPGPPHAVIPVLLLPRRPPPEAGAADPGPIRLHRRPQRLAAVPPPVAPLHVPRKVLEVPRRSRTPPSPTPPPPLTDEVRQALRLGTVGCAHADLMRLSRAEREACEDQLAAGARDAPWIPPGKSAARRAELQAEAARKDALVRRKERQMGPGLASPFAKTQDYDGDPYTSGAGVSLFGPPTHPPSKRAAPVLGRLPP